MRLGKLNEPENNIGFRVTFADSEKVTHFDTWGNPLKGEKLHAHRKHIRDFEIALHISLHKECFVDTVVLNLGDKPAFSGVVIRQDDQVLCRHDAETGKTIRDRKIALAVGAMCKDFTVVVSPEFSTLEILSLDIYGAIEDGIGLPSPAIKAASVRMAFWVDRLLLPSAMSTCPRQISPLHPSN